MPEVPVAGQRTWVVGAGSLTRAQNRIVHLDTSRHHLVYGPVGSGKTLVALHRARRLMAQEACRTSLRVLVASEVLRRHVRSGAVSLGLPAEIVQTFRSWVFDVARDRGLLLPPSRDAEERLDLILEKLLACFEEDRSGPIIDLVLVDDGQELPRDGYRLLSLAARHVTVCADETLQPEGARASLAAAAWALGLTRRFAFELRSIRRSKRVARLASSFLPAGRRNAYLQASQPAPHAGTGRVPAFFRAASEGEEWKRLASVVRGEVERGARVALLLPTSSLVARAAVRLRKLGVQVKPVVGPREAGKANFADLTPKSLTVQGMNGLSFDSVLLPRLSIRAYWGVDDVSSLLFAGAARALDWVYLSTTRGEELPEIGRLFSLIRDGTVVDLAARRTVRPPVSGCDGEEDLPL